MVRGIEEYGLVFGPVERVRVRIIRPTEGSPEVERQRQHSEVSREAPYDAPQHPQAKTRRQFCESQKPILVHTSTPNLSRLKKPGLFHAVPTPATVAGPLPRRSPVAWRNCR